MSLFEYAQEVVSRKLEREKPMLTISMGMQPVMPMAQGGGLSSVQNSLNINGQPHRLAYINPSEENLLKSLGGSGRKIDGVPAYYDAGNDSDPDSGDTTGQSFGGLGPDDSDPDSSDNTNPGFGTPDSPSSPTSGYGDTFDMNSFPDISPPDNQNLNPYFPPPDLWDKRDDLNRSPNKTVSVNPVIVGIGAILGPVAAAIANAFGIGKSMSFDIGIPGTGTKGGYGDTGTGNQGGSGQDDDDGTDDGTEAGGDDYIIKEKIAAVKQVPVEEVTVEEVQRAKRLTAAQRVTGTRLEDILDDIYGSGKGAGLLGIPTNNTGTA
jgi:hypothetical protein